VPQPADPRQFEAVFERDGQSLPPAAGPLLPPNGAAPAGGGAQIAAPAVPVSQEEFGEQYQEQLQSFLNDPQANPGLGLALFLIAVLLGGLHALTPGHGKGVVAAYLIGSRGRVRDAVMLGGIVTFTHTISVIALGLGVLAITN